jgi:hypothetical protein
MNNRSLSESFSELNQAVRNYVDARIRYWKVLLLEKSTRAITFLFSSVVVLITLVTSLIFLGFAFSFWFEEKGGSLWLGFLITAGFHLFLTLIFFLFRKAIFSGSIIKNLRDLLFPDKEEK